MNKIYKPGDVVTFRLPGGEERVCVVERYLEGARAFIGKEVLAQYSTPISVLVHDTQIIHVGKVV